MCPRPKGSKNRKTKSKQYWTKEVDQAIITYNSLKPSVERDRLFTNQIYPVLSKLAQGVLSYLKWNKKLELDEDEEKNWVLENISHMTTVLGKYKDITKAGFSYFQTISKHEYLDYLMKKSFNETNLLPIEIDNEDDDTVSLADKLLVEDRTEIWEEYKDKIIEEIRKKKCYVPETKPILLEIIKYLETEVDPDYDGLRLHIIHNFIDNGLMEAWKVDRLLYLENIYLAIKDRSDYRNQEKHGELEDNNWDWVHDAFKLEMEPWQLARQQFQSRKAARKPVNKENKEQARKKETPEQRAHRLEIGKKYREKLRADGEIDMYYMRTKIKRNIFNPKKPKEINQESNVQILGKRTDRYDYETPEHREKRLAYARERARRIKMLSNKPDETPEQKAIRCAKARAAYKQLLANETPEQKEERKKKKAEQKAKRLSKRLGRLIFSETNEEK